MEGVIFGIVEFVAFREGVLEVLLDIKQRGGGDDQGAVFKVKVEGTVIEIDGPDDPHCIIDEASLRVDESRGVFVYLASVQEQFPIMGTG